MQSNNGTKTNDTTELEWARINDRQVVVATNEDAFIHEIEECADVDPFAEPMTCAGSVETTRRLLDAAWYAASLDASGDGFDHEHSLIRYTWELIGSHYLTSATPKILREAADRFAEIDRPDLEKFARVFARLESGDEQMARNDLEALGFDTEALVRNIPAPSYAIEGVAFFEKCARGSNPLDIFGYAYAVERSSLAVTRDDLREYEKILPEGVGTNALTCRWHHSGVGGDVGHVRYFIRKAASLRAIDRAYIARSTYNARRFLLGLPAMDETDLAKLERVFRRFERPSTEGATRK